MVAWLVNSYCKEPSSAKPGGQPSDNSNSSHTLMMCTHHMERFACYNYVYIDGLCGQQEVRRAIRDVHGTKMLNKRQPALCLTCIQLVLILKRKMEQVTAVGKGATFFLLLVLAASASATSLNTKQKNTME